MSSCDRLLGLFGDETDWAVAQNVAMALFNRGEALGNLGRHDDAVGEYDRVVDAYGAVPAAAEIVAWSLVNMGIELERLGKLAEAVRVYESLAARFAGASEPPLIAQMAKASFNTGNALALLGRAEDAVAEYERVVRDYAGEPLAARDVAAALANRASLLCQLHRRAEALDACGEFRRLAAGLPGDEVLRSTEVVARVERECGSPAN